MKTSTYFVYILECKDSTLYTGIATDVTRRFAEHQAGIGSKYTRAKGVLRILYQEAAEGRAEASRRERAIKKLTREQKLILSKVHENKIIIHFKNHKT